MELREPSRKVKRRAEGELCPLCLRHLFWSDVIEIVDLATHVDWMHIQCQGLLRERIEEAQGAMSIDPEHLTDDPALS